MDANYKSVHPDNLDWLSFAAPDDIHAPHPDLFEFELDNSLNGIDQSQLQFLNLDFNSEPYKFFRDDNVVCGPPSTITISSESAYDARSSHSESLYSFPHSPTYTSIESVYSNDLSMNFANFRMDVNDSAVAAPQPLPSPTTIRIFDDTDTDSNSFGEIPPSPYDSVSNGNFDYDNPSSIDPISVIRPADFYLSPQPTPAPQRVSATSSTTSPIGIPHPIPRLTLSMSEAPSTSHSPTDHSNGDSRRRYQCPSCPRAFARAYNLKTHMATHDPHRPKPFTCPHKSCGRSFSRKHDLGRHLVSIHHDEPENNKIGVQGGNRVWCDTCGKGWTGASAGCSCAT